MEIRLAPNQSEDSKHNLILVDLTRIQKDFSVCEKIASRLE